MANHCVILYAIGPEPHTRSLMYGRRLAHYICMSAGSARISLTGVAGELPDAWAAWDAEHISLGLNTLAGNLPSSWGTNWTKIQWLDLNTNSLTGVIALLHVRPAVHHL